MLLGDFLNTCSVSTPVRIKSCQDDPSKIIYDGFAGGAVMDSHNWNKYDMFYNIYSIEWTVGKRNSCFLTIWIYKQEDE